MVSTIDVKITHNRKNTAPSVTSNDHYLSTLNMLNMGTNISDTNSAITNDMHDHVFENNNIHDSYVLDISMCGRNSLDLQLNSNGVKIGPLNI